MHRHDLELIAALADGSLEDETFARERVETCDECRAEFKAQSAAIAALATVASATMTGHEKAALHRDLWTELRTGSPTQAAPSAPWWYRWSYAAAGLFVVVGLVAVLTQVNGGGDAATEALSVDETIAASADDGGDLQGGAAPFEETGESDGAAETISPAANDGFAFSDLAEQLKSMRHTGRALSVEEESQYDDCLSDAGLDDHQVIETHTVDETEYLTVIAADAPDDESNDVTYVDAITCVIVGQDE